MAEVIRCPKCKSVYVVIEKKKLFFGRVRCIGCSKGNRQELEKVCQSCKHRW